MQREQLFPQPDFIPAFDRFEGLAGLRIGLTGHRGVLGRILDERLQRHGVRVDRYPGDVSNASTLRTWLASSSFQLFFHFAAIVPIVKVERDPVRAFDVNALSAYEICRELARKPEICWFFLASTSHVYRPAPVDAWRPLKVGDPEVPGTLYGRTKLAGESLCRQFLEALGRPYCIGRIFSFSHRSQSDSYLVPGLTRRIHDLGRGQKLKLVNAHAIRDILDAETVVDAILHLALRRWQGTVNIGSGIPMSVAEIARHVGHLLGKEVAIEPEAAGEADALVADIQPLRSIVDPGCQTND